jgi:hypothetical protein
MVSLRSDRRCRLRIEWCVLLEVSAELGQLYRGPTLAALDLGGGHSTEKCETCPWTTNQSTGVQTCAWNSWSCFSFSDTLTARPHFMQHTLFRCR